MVSEMGTAYRPGKTGRNMRAAGRTIAFMGLEYTRCQTDRDTKADGKTIRGVGREWRRGRVVISMKVSILITSRKAMVFTLVPMEVDTMAPGKMDAWMATALTRLPTATGTKAIGDREQGMERELASTQRLKRHKRVSG